MYHNVYVGLEAFSVQPGAHLTVMYLGTIDEERYRYVHGYLNAYVDEYAVRHREHQAVRHDIRLFGYKESIPVVTLSVPDSIMHIREFLMHHGIEGQTEYNWTPHISLDLECEDLIKIPKHIGLRDLYVGSKEKGHDPI